MKKLSLLLALVFTGITFFACMKDAPTEVPKGVLTVKNLTANDGFAIGDSVKAEVSAVMIDLSKIEFYFDGSLKASSSSDHYFFAIPTTGLSAGTHQVKIVAYGADGSLEQSVPVSLVNGVPPVCTITAPAANANIKIGTAVDITATASDADGSVASVSFYANGVLISTDTSSPYAASWSTTGLGEGVNTLKATAKDNMGITKSDQVAVNLFLSVPPNVEITSPADNSSITQGNSVTITANATDIDGTIAEVRFLIDNVLKTTDTASPYSYDWSTAGLAVGSQHTIKVIAKDNTGKEGENSISVSIKANTPPSVDIAELTNGGSVEIATTNTITANATDTDGTIAEVRFYIDNVLKATDTASPYSYDWSTAGLVANSSHIIKVIAKDNGGLESEKSITVIATSHPMALVEGGTFNMGDASVATPVHSVTLSNYYIGYKEVTQAQWLAVMGSNPSHFTGDLNRPVEQVSWYDIMVFCNKKSVLDGLTPCYSISGSTDPTAWGAVPTTTNATWNAAVCNWTAKGYRMPTEAEWEYAARGGKNSLGYTYSGSNTIGDVVWYATNSSSTTHPVGTKAANELGLYDMSGNVWEWNWDWYAAYTAAAQTNPTGAATGSYRVIRGGSYHYEATQCHVASRSGNWQYEDSYDIGFRLVRSP